MVEVSFEDPFWGQQGSLSPPYAPARRLDGKHQPIQEPCLKLTCHQQDNSELRVASLALPCVLGRPAPAGQHFLAHEDGFPASATLEKGYNRRATLLVYLNDVPQVSWSMHGSSSVGIDTATWPGAVNMTSSNASIHHNSPPWNVH